MTIFCNCGSNNWETVVDRQLTHFRMRRPTNFKLGRQTEPRFAKVTILIFLLRAAFKLCMRLIAKVIRISHAKFHCHRLTTVQDCQGSLGLPTLSFDNVAAAEGLSDVHVHVNHGVELFISVMSYDVMTQCHSPSWLRVVTLQ